MSRISDETRLSRFSKSKNLEPSAREWVNDPVTLEKDFYLKKDETCFALNWCSSDGPLRRVQQSDNCWSNRTIHYTLNCNLSKNIVFQKISNEALNLRCSDCVRTFQCTGCGFLRFNRLWNPCHAFVWLFAKYQ